ncbi:MAG: serine hydrolase [Fluviicola sp.]
MKWILILGMGLLFSCSHSQSETDTHVAEKQRNSILDSLEIDMEVARNPKYRFQFVATSIQNGTAIKSVAYGTDKYYYPASLVKVPAALVLLEVLNERNIPLDAIPVFDTINACGSTKFVEISKEHQVSFRQMLTELIVASDNHFYNAIYHFITPKELNERLRRKGLQGVKVYRAFTGCNRTDQLRTYPYKVFERSSPEKLIYVQNASVLDSAVLESQYSFSQNRLFGSKHENSAGEIVEGPYDLNYHIEIPLEQMHTMMRFIFYPSHFPEEKKWNIRESDLTYLKEMLGTFPSEIPTSYRSLKHLKDREYKYVLRLQEGKTRTFGKLGLSYGFASECVYVPSEGIGNGVLLSYSVYVNSNDIVNDGEYDYETVARPFAEELFSKILKWHKK